MLTQTSNVKYNLRNFKSYIRKISVIQVCLQVGEKRNNKEKIAVGKTRADFIIKTYLIELIMIMDLLAYITLLKISFSNCKNF